MSKNKLERFAEISRFDNVLELDDYQDEEKKKPRGLWASEVFQSNNPLILELACGKGTYTLELAKRFPDKNYVGVDIKGSRIWKGAKNAREKELDNVRFLRIYIDHLEEYFGVNEVDEIWITFPDPYPKGSDRSKRLTSEKFLKKYQSVLKESGTIHLKTDSTSLFRFTKRSVRHFGGSVCEELPDVYGMEAVKPELAFQTDFEKKHLAKGRTIKYLNFRLPPLH